MNWKRFWDQQATLNSHPQAQVGRIRKGLTVQAPIVEAITARISSLLDLQPSDHLLDLCCGNGMLTFPLADNCQQVVGVDISSEQIALAEAHASKDNIRYHLADVTKLLQDPAFPTIAPQGGFDKINLYFSFQYFDTQTKGKAALKAMLHFLKEDGILLLGDVPEQKYFNTFYPTLKSKIKYHLKRLIQQDDMGKFWNEKTLKQIAHSLGAQIERIEQPAHLPYADYRCDYLIRKAPI